MIAFEGMKWRKTDGIAPITKTLCQLVRDVSRSCKAYLVLEEVKKAKEEHETQLIEDERLKKKEERRLSNEEFKQFNLKENILDKK